MIARSKKQAAETALNSHVQWTMGTLDELHKTHEKRKIIIQSREEKFLDLLNIGFAESISSEGWISSDSARKATEKLYNQLSFACLLVTQCLSNKGIKHAKFQKDNPTHSYKLVSCRILNLYRNCPWILSRSYSSKIFQSSSTLNKILYVPFPACWKELFSAKRKVSNKKTAIQIFDCLSGIFLVGMPYK